MTDDTRSNPDHTPPLPQAAALGLQHVLAMFVSNVTPALIVAGAAGFAASDPAALVYLIQMAMLFAGIATLLQTLGAGPVGARLPLVQGTSFAFLPVMIPLVSGRGAEGMALIAGGVIAGGLFHVALAPIIGRLRFALPPLVTGLVVLMIGLSLVRVGIQYAAGGVGATDYGAPHGWALALLVVTVTLALTFFGRGWWSVSAVLLGLVAGYLAALALGMVDFSTMGQADWLALPQVLPFGIAFSVAAVAGFCLMALVSAIETVGDVSGVARAGADRDATDPEITGATAADGVGSLLAGLFGGLPNTTFSQNVGLVAITGVMSRHAVSLGAVFLLAAGLVPKVGAVLATIPIQVLGGGVIVMFGMVCAAGVRMLAGVDWSRRNMVIFGTSLSFGLGLQLEPMALGQLPQTAQILLASGLVPAAGLAITLNLALPRQLPGD